MLTKKDHQSHAEGNAKHAARLRERAETLTDRTVERRRALATANVLDRIAAAHAKRA